MIKINIAGLGERSINIARHIAWSMLLKIGSIISNFIMIPLAIEYLGVEDYGAWLTISSFLNWFMLFDIGLGNGLRNKFALAKALGNHDEAKALVSTAYYTITAISLSLIIILYIISCIVDWTIIFNTTPEKSHELSTLLPILFTIFGLSLIAKLIVSIYQANQHHSINDKIQFFTQILLLITVWSMLHINIKSLLLFGSIYTLLPLLVLITLNIFAFNGIYKEYKPTIKLFQKKQLKEISGLGLKFFIIQIATVVIFSTDNFIITHLFGPSKVVPYNVAFKYFSIVTMIYSIIVAPYWSSCTDAYAKNDIKWIKNSVLRIQKIWLFIPASLLAMVLAANHVYAIWIDNKIIVPQSMNIYMAIYIMTITFNTVYVQFINGVGKIKLQLIISIIVMIMNIPLSILLADHMKMGPQGVILATSICVCFPMTLWIIQYNKIINGTAKGIWNK